jgi:hypothetical protein
MLLPTGSRTDLVDIPVMIGINIVPRVSDAIAGMGVIAESSAAAERFTRVDVARNPRGGAVHHSSLGVVSCCSGFSGVISGIAVAYGSTRSTIRPPCRGVIA